MKSILKHALFATAGAALLSSSAMAVVTYTNGDLLLGFRKTGDPDTYVYNLGSSTSFRDGSNPTFLGNISADLTLAFGAGWATDSTISFGAVGTQANVGVINGDPRRTVYASVGATVPGASSPWTLTTSQVQSASTNVGSFATGTGGFNSATETANSSGRGAIIPTSNDNSWEDFNTGGGSFGVFGSGLEVTASGTGAPYYLDIYRLLQTTTGANPGGTAGSGSYETTIMLDSAGNLWAIPEPGSVMLSGLGAGLILLRRRRTSTTA